MSFSTYLIGLKEQVNTEEDGIEEINESELDFDYVDDSGFVNEIDSDFGSIKIDHPTTEGLDAAEHSANQFAHAGDEEDVDLSINDMFDDDSGFSDSLSGFDEIPIKDDTIPVDPYTVPRHIEEDDQYESEEECEDAEDTSISDTDLVDEIDESLNESFDYWEDLL